MTSDRWWLAVLLLLTCLGIIVARQVWVKRYSPYERGVHNWVGESGRHGCDASAAFVVVPFSFATLAFIASEGTGPLFDALVMIGVVGLILGLVECHVLLLFLWPRVFVPPHLRNQRGWVAQALHDRTAPWSRPRSGCRFGQRPAKMSVRSCQEPIA